MYFHQWCVLRVEITIIIVVVLLVVVIIAVIMIVNMTPNKKRRQLNPQLKKIIKELQGKQFALKEN